MPVRSVWRVLAPDNPSKIKPASNVVSRLTLDDISAQLPSGVYTTFRTFEHRKVLPLEPQFLRLEESAALMNTPVSLNRSHIRAAIREAAQWHPGQDNRIRLTLDLEEDPGTIYISIEPLSTPGPADYENGVATMTRRGERRNPKAKYTSFMSSVKMARDQMPEGVNEILLVNGTGRILEGLSSNFFAVVQGEIWTEDQSVLSGIVRSLVLEQARLAGILVHLQGTLLSDLESLEEAFLTSASRSVLPIHKIDVQIVGRGNPGPITKKLMGDYQRLIETQTQEL